MAAAVAFTSSLTENVGAEKVWIALRYIEMVSHAQAGRPEGRGRRRCRNTCCLLRADFGIRQTEAVGTTTFREGRYKNSARENCGWNFWN